MANYFRKGKSLYSSTANTFGTGEGETITPASVSGLPTTTEIVLTFDRVDSSGTETPTKLERILGTISGGNFVVSTGGRGYDGTTEQAHTSPVVEYIYNAADLNDTMTGILTQHTQTGTHGAVTASTVTASNITASHIVATNSTTSSTITTSHVIAGRVTGASKFPAVYGEYSNGNSGSAVTVNWLNGDRQFACITASTTVTFASAIAGQYLHLRTYHSASAYTVTLPTVKWPEGTVVAPTTTASAINLYIFYYDGTNYLTQLAKGFA